MMANEYLPLIEAKHYEAMRALFPSLPSTYEEWEEKHEWRKRELENNNDVVFEVEVTPDELQEFCRDRDEAITRLSLHRFAMENGQR